jgi:hypothetical protein
VYIYDTTSVVDKLVNIAGGDDEGGSSGDDNSGDEGAGDKDESESSSS